MVVQVSKRDKRTAAKTARKKLEVAKSGAKTRRVVFANNETGDNIPTKPQERSKKRETPGTPPLKRGKVVKQHTATGLADIAKLLADIALYLADAANSSSNVDGSKPLPAATIRALAELKAGKLTYSVDADGMFSQLGIKVGKTKA